MVVNLVFYKYVTIGNKLVYGMYLLNFVTLLWTCTTMGWSKTKLFFFRLTLCRLLNTPFTACVVYVFKLQQQYQDHLSTRAHNIIIHHIYGDPDSETEVAEVRPLVAEQKLLQHHIITSDDITTVIRLFSTSLGPMSSVLGES